MLRYAPIEWLADGTPKSAQFDDVYFSRASGRAETEYVFLQGCGLPEGWMRSGTFTIAETGFGTGLNFLHTWQRFIDTAPVDARLHFISVEAFPLSPHDLARALAGWEGPEAALLQAQYPLPVPGWHRMHFDRVTLTLGLGDAETLLAEVDARVDAWFLDGFAPAKNDTMWSDALYAQCARLSHGGTRIASFTAAGAVRRGLAAHGFAIERRDGFGHKRHALHGVFAAGEAPPQMHVPQHVTVIGAGIAGASVARALAKRGTQVMLLDAAPRAGAGASGNPAAVLYPHITQQFGANMAWHVAGFAQAVRMLADAPYAHLTGMLKTPKDAKDDARLRAACAAFEPELVRWVQAEEAQQLLGAAASGAGAWFARSGWVDPRAWCEDLLSHAAIDVRYGAQVLSLARVDEGWQMQGADGSTLHATDVVLCNGFAAETLLESVRKKMFQSAGQISLLPAQASTHALKAVLCHRGYMVPQAEGTLVGATYDHDDLSLEVTDANHARNAQEAQRALPGFVRSMDSVAWQGRTALRASTRDRLPLVGAAASGLYLSAGHGSRGMVSAPLAAELIASMVHDEPLPVSRTLAGAVHPLRVI